jgi:hypothetical protein
MRLPVRSYVTEVGHTCSMQRDTYSATCATNIVRSRCACTALPRRLSLTPFVFSPLPSHAPPQAEQLGVYSPAVAACMGAADDDVPNELLEGEKRNMQSSGRRGDVALFPTLIANGVQFRGDLDNITVLEFLCAGYPAGGAPPQCLARGIMTAPCEAGHFGAETCAGNGAAGGSGATHCADTQAFPFWTCACPMGSTYVSGPDGAPTCVASNACLTRAVGVCVPVPVPALPAALCAVRCALCAVRACADAT